MIIHPNSVVIPSEARDLLFHGAKQYIRSPTHSHPTAPRSPGNRGSAKLNTPTTAER